MPKKFGTSATLQLLNYYFFDIFELKVFYTAPKISVFNFFGETCPPVELGTFGIF